MYRESEMQKVSAAMGEKGVSIQRYKGLGEMNAQPPLGHDHGPKEPNLPQGLDQGAYGADGIYKTLMGKDVEIRKNFIMRHAKEVTTPTSEVPPAGSPETHRAGRLASSRK